MSMSNTAVATPLSPFTIPKEIALELNGLWNYAFVVQKPWDYDYPVLKRRAELIRDAKQRGIVIWSSLARATDLKTKHIIICLGAVPREKEVGLDTEHWGHVTIETYSRLVEKIEYQSLV
ncbi:hypothetical protein I302_104276 [Kwoniella bestiolae CBS 10118]|uniref:Uncharacterized protein n=1 Tax=Kwoniella bestiolae CBS 10118 TaxID=1296100 RepID=A0A1B9GAT0_9TREE|nr:hypothetical protein I302_02984 [Kwoniella bestiolae CBS 10118]OCF28133.1 hypothetical protein I302_02984 [Kwoniella bestiolae CBS 10118]